MVLSCHSEPVELFPNWRAVPRKQQHDHKEARSGNYFLEGTEEECRSAKEESDRCGEEDDLLG